MSVRGFDHVAIPIERVDAMLAGGKAQAEAGTRRRGVSTVRGPDAASAPISSSSRRSSGACLLVEQTV